MGLVGQPNQHPFEPQGGDLNSPYPSGRGNGLAPIFQVYFKFSQNVHRNFGNWMDARHSRNAFGTQNNEEVANSHLIAINIRHRESALWSTLQRGGGNHWRKIMELQFLVHYQNILLKPTWKHRQSSEIVHNFGSVWCGNPRNRWTRFTKKNVSVQCFYSTSAFIVTQYSLLL